MLYYIQFIQYFNTFNYIHYTILCSEKKCAYMYHALYSNCPLTNPCLRKQEGSLHHAMIQFCSHSSESAQFYVKRMLLSFIIVLQLCDDQSSPYFYRFVIHMLGQTK